MTTGSRTYDRRQTFTLPGGGTAKAGEVISITWSGGDSITPTIHRDAFTRKQARPSRITKEEIRALRAEAERTGALFVNLLYDLRAKKRLAAIRQRVLLPPNNFTKTIIHRYESIWNGVTDGTYKGIYSSMYDPWGGNHAPVDPGKEYKLIAKLREKAYGSGFNPAVFTAEGREAFNMIGDAASSLTGALKSLRKGDVRGVAKHLTVSVREVRRAFNAKRTMSGRWLELQYGWLPLVSDMEEGAKYLASALNESKYGRNKLVARKTWYTEEDAPSGAYKTSPYFSKRVCVFQLQYIIYGLQKSPVYLPSLWTVASVAWEKLPWSFVGDWVVPIGAYLEACRTAADLKGKVVRTLRRDYITTSVSFGTRQVFQSWYSPLFGQPRIHYTRVDRTVSEELQPPSPVTGMATDLTFLSWRRAANAVALLTQFASKR